MPDNSGSHGQGEQLHVGYVVGVSPAVWGTESGNCDRMYLAQITTNPVKAKETEKKNGTKTCSVR